QRRRKKNSEAKRSMANQLDLFADSCLKAVHNESLFRSARSNHLAKRKRRRSIPCRVSLPFYGSSLEHARATAHSRDLHQPALCRFLPERDEPKLRLAWPQSLRYVGHGCGRQSCYAVSCSRSWSLADLSEGQ